MPGGSKWKQIAEDYRTRALKAGRNAAARFAEADETGELAVLGGSAVSGFLDGNDIEIVYGDPGKGEPMAIPGGLAVGVATYVAGRYLKQSLVRKAGLGMVAGGTALLVSDLTRRAA